MTQCMDCGKPTLDGHARCERCTDKLLKKLPRPSADAERYQDTLYLLTQEYLIREVELPRQIAQHPAWTDQQITRAAIKEMNGFMQDPNRLGVLFSKPPRAVSK